MIRTTLSVCALFATLLLASRWVGLTTPAAPSAQTSSTQPTAKPTSEPAKEPKAEKPAPTTSAANETDSTTTIKLAAVPGAPFKMPDGCVEITASDLAKIEGANTDGKVRVAVAEYLHGPIPTPHDYVLRTVDFEEEPSDETDDVFGFRPKSSRRQPDSIVDFTPAPFPSSRRKPLIVVDEDREDATETETPTEDESTAKDPSDLRDLIDVEAEMVEQSPAGDTETETSEGDETETTVVEEEETIVVAPQPQKEEIELTPELIQLRENLRDCLAHYYYRPENVANRSPWGAMHYMLAYGVDSQLIAGDRKVNAVGWLCYNGVCNGQNLFWAENNKLKARIGVGVQGHAGQFLAMLAQSKVPTDFPIKASGRDFTVADLIEHEKDTCRPNTELTFKLIALMHYCKSDETWISFEGQEWDIPRLIKEELRQPIVGAACGGTHRLMGLSYAVRKRQARGEEFTGQWLRAKKFIDDYHEYTFRLQNPDGSFSTDWFVGRADFGPPGRRLETTGHITEWLAYSLSEEQLTEPRMVKSVTYLTNLLNDGRNGKWNIGPLGHGLHALAIYDERVFGGKPGQRDEQLAAHEKKLAVKRRVGDMNRR